MEPTTKELTYRMGNMGDLKALKELALLSFGQYHKRLTPENWAVMRGNIDNDARFADLIGKAAVFVCCSEHEIVGVAYLLSSGNPTEVFRENWSYIRMVSVHPAFEGKGIGRMLTEQCIEHAKLTDEKIVALHTSEIMDAARHIYESMGFRVEREIGKTYGITYWLYLLNLGV